MRTMPESLHWIMPAAELQMGGGGGRVRGVDVYRLRAVASELLWQRLQNCEPWHLRLRHP